KRKIII
ncbi:ipaH-like protein, partial [Escherichia coli EC1870]